MILDNVARGWSSWILDMQGTRRGLYCCMGSSWICMLGDFPIGIQATLDIEWLHHEVKVSICDLRY